MTTPVLFEIPTSLISLTENELYTTTASQYNQIQDAYKRFPLPDDILFPWLHGVDGLSNQQNLFFGVRRSMVPNYRGLMLIHCNPTETKSRLVESVLPEQVIDEQGHFLNTCDITINLRNFQNQVARFATICDIVCYGSNAKFIGQLILNAQKKLFEERQTQIDTIARIAGKRAIVNANRIQYKTIIIEDEFSMFEEMYPKLVMFDSTGIAVTHHNFLELENIEMREMSKASEISKNIWMGNTQDVPISSFKEDMIDNPNQFSICIEAHDLADMPLPSTLTLAREILNDVQSKPTEIIHFDVYATGISQEKNQFEKFYNRLLGLLKFMQDQVIQDRKILIHCSDGYTETSLLGLSWIMYHLKLSLPEAYLYLQKRRSFFVYACDLPTLRRIELLLFGQEIIEPEPKRKKSEQYDYIERLKISNNNNHTNEISDDDNDDDDDNMDDEDDMDDKELLIYNQINNNQGSIYTQLQLSPTKEEEELYPWFYSSRFEGSFPSRILPYLYLGNLNHATNHDMLKALNVTHVVSVGENAGLNQSDFKLLYLDNLYDDGIDSIKTRLDSVLEFVDEARINGTICLIHCRVGVSRSAAITICYLMKYMKYTLVSAYLFVRAHRLNVIIQPNLKFMYEMLQLEQKETGTTTITWPILCQEIYNLNLSFRDTSISSENKSLYSTI